MSTEKDTSQGKIYIVFFAVCALAMGVAVKMFAIQLAEEPEFKEMAETFVTDYRSIEAARGNILADDGSLLATSLPIYDIRMDMRADGLKKQVFQDNVHALAADLAGLFAGHPRASTEAEYLAGLKKAYADGKRYYLVQAEATYNEVQAAKEFPIFNKGRFKGGVLYEKKNERMYPFKMLANRTIGYMKDGVTPVGLEGAYAKQLKGRDGKRLERRLVGGQWMPVSDSNDIEPEDGLDIVTSLDINIQDVAERALLRTLETNKAHHGSVVLMEVETGMVKAIANLKQSDDGERYYEAFNYAIGEATEPGSTMKLASLMAALEEGVVDLDDMVDTERGVVRYYGRKMKDSHEGGYGKISVQRCFEVSSNVGMSKIITEHFGKDPQRYVDRLHAMNISTPTGIEIKGEPSPMIKNTTHKTWSGLTLPWMSIGYEALMTPLQTLTFYNAVANDGKMLRPQFVQEMRDKNEVVWRAEPVVLNPSIASKSTIAKAQAALLGVVENGTANNLKNDQFLIAGKTGTAQIANQEGNYGVEGERSYQASFVGYFPADDPKYSCIVVVSAPSQAIYYGNLVAGPVFKEISDKVYAKRFDIQREQEAIAGPADVTPIPVSKDGSQSDLDRVFAEFGVETKSVSPDAQWVVTRTGMDNVETEARRVSSDKVPNVKGMGLSDAVFLLENNGLTVNIEGSGHVKKQSVDPGVTITDDMTITITLGL